MKPSRNGEIVLPFTDVGKSCTSCKFLLLQINMSFNAIRENRVLKIFFEFSTFEYLNRYIVIM